jgi:hypothetical protein
MAGAPPLKRFSVVAYVPPGQTFSNATRLTAGLVMGRAGPDYFVQLTSSGDLYEVSGPLCQLHAR